MFKLNQVYLKIPQKSLIIQLCQCLRKYSSPVSAVPKTQKSVRDNLGTELNLAKEGQSGKINSKNPMVAAAFAALTSNTVTEIKTPRTDERIKEAQTVEELLSLANGSGISRRFALKIVSVLADWCTAEKVQLYDFDTDPRFIKLCKILTKAGKTKSTPQSEDLSMVINISADDEAARLINNLTLPQMVRIVGMLASKQRRSLSLLRSISFNISRSQEFLDIKQCADLLYGIVVLNYFDDILLDKICGDICTQIKENTRGSAVVGSILTSLGLLRYKNPPVLDALSEWIVTNIKTVRSQDAFALFLTLAVSNHQPDNYSKLYETVIPQLSEKDAPKLTTWLDYVWSLIVLNQASERHINSVLQTNFIERVDQELQIPHKLKVLNINAAANYLIDNYNLSKLNSSSDMFQIAPLYSKSKKTLVESVIESLSNMFPMESYLKTNINNGLGFCLDGECVVDENKNPLPLNKVTDRSITVGVMVLDFHDMCRGKIEPSGMNILFERLLRARGYKVLTVPYTEYNPKDKLVQRVQYLKNKLKAIT